MTEKYTITGLVQGIGFRPSVKRAAIKHGISGFVKNTGGSVTVTASGGETALAEFKREIKAMPQSIITRFTVSEASDGGFEGFEIIMSDSENNELPVIPPDVSVCQSCMREFYDKSNRRYMHPFISCTRCGPRYSVISRLPYDRENITMADFGMCGKCQKEYRDINDIRAHAQTIACMDCGPVLSYTLSGDPLEETAKTLKCGGIAAIKDIGGYHFACDARNETAVLRLREIKSREKKPFAVMFSSLEQIMEYAYVSDMERELLQSAAKPIVLLRKRKEFAPPVCGQSDYIGAFLPCNSVQYFLTEKCGPLVMTSANISGEPIIINDEDISELKKRAGGFEILSHDRRILTPLDDSVCRVLCGRAQMLRRGRGYTPLPVEINSASDDAVLAMGGDLKASFCFAKGNAAYMSQYFGDLENADAYRAWKKNISRLAALLKIGNYATVGDLHPLYLSAQNAGTAVQHHYAHMASVMAEHKINEPSVGFIFDGTGFGTDGNVWGGEVIRYDGEFHRISALDCTELLGGDESAKNAELTLDCYLLSAGLGTRSENGGIVKAAVKNGVNTVRSSSMGRLFDAVSALTGVCSYNSYEGECAILLENAARRANEPYPLTLKTENGKWNGAALIREIAAAIDDGADKHSLALGFHEAVINAVVELAKTCEERNVILSGGVFANEILSRGCIERLEKAGYNVYTNEQVPVNDGGIALGQAWIALNCDGGK